MNEINLIELFEALSFSADKHRLQKRKDATGTPYINHPLGVARNIAFLDSLTGKEKSDIINGAILHDTIEDTDTTYEEIQIRFNKEVADIVQEVTNKKELSSEESKKYELERAKTLSLPASLIRISDKIENIKDINNLQPVNWEKWRKINYCEWAKALVDNIKIEHVAVKQLKNLFLQRYYETLNSLK